MCLDPAVDTTQILETDMERRKVCLPYTSTPYMGRKLAVLWSCSYMLDLLISSVSLLCVGQGSRKGQQWVHTYGIVYSSYAITWQCWVTLAFPIVTGSTYFSFYLSEKLDILSQINTNTTCIDEYGNLVCTDYKEFCSNVQRYTLLSIIRGNTESYFLIKKGILGNCSSKWIITFTTGQ